MKKALIITLLAFFSVVCAGQSKGCLKFLGIPVDGTEAQFTAKLKGKGFVYISTFDCFRGEFNGEKVDVYIHTNHNLVDRVYVEFPRTSEENIKGAFNRLLGQFKGNNKYVELNVNSEISSDEDISYEISVNKKRYQASFSYFNPERDFIEIQSALIDKFDEFFTPEQKASIKASLKHMLEASDEEREQIQSAMLANLYERLSQNENGKLDEEKALRFLMTMIDGAKSLADGDVWFMIHEIGSYYSIGLYYDNLHNQAHGEDL